MSNRQTSLADATLFPLHEVDPETLKRFDRIRDDLRDCTTIDQVNKLVRKIEAVVFGLATSDNQADRTLAIIIKNLAKYRRGVIAEGEQ